MKWKLWRKGEKKPKTATCSCEVCRFSSEVDKIFPDKKMREIVSPFITFPSSVVEVDPDKKVEEGEYYEKQNEIFKAAESYRSAVIAAIAKDGYKVEKYCETLLKFIEKHETSYLAPENLKEIMNNPEITQSLRKAYQNFLREKK